MFRFSSVTERIVSSAGLTLVGAALSKAFKPLRDRFSFDPSSPEARIPITDIIRTAVGNMLNGSPQYESVSNLLNDSAFYAEALQINERIPSEASLRQRIEKFADLDSTRENMRKLNISLLKENRAVISPLANGMVCIDCDVSPFDNSKSNKEGVGRTYKGCDGYAPMFAYIGKEGFCLNTDFRPGTQHCQKNTDKFLEETIGFARDLTDSELLFRLDSGNDAGENIRIFRENRIHFIIKRNPRDELPESWMDIALHESSSIKHPREGKTVFKGTCFKDASYKVTEEYTTKSGKVKSRVVKKEIGPVKVVYEVTYRTIDRHGQLLLLPEIETDSYWTDLDADEETVIQLYHDHGEMEQYHSEFKSDMDLERLPSGKFNTNALILDLAVLALNTARLISQHLASEDVPLANNPVRRRVKTIIRYFIRIPGHITKHARYDRIGLGISNSFVTAFRNIYGKIVNPPDLQLA